MNPKFKILLYFFIGVLSVTDALAGGHIMHNDDPLMKTFIANPRQLPDYGYQQTLMLQSYWQNFSAENETWKVIFNENSTMPHRAYGKPIAVAGYDIRSTAENFIANQLAGFHIPFSQLQFRSISTNNKYHYVNYLQFHQGLEVLFTNVQVRMTHDYRVNQFALDCYRNIPLSISPSITGNSAAYSASADVQGITHVNVSPSLKVLPVPGNRSYNFHLVYEVTVENIDEEGIPGRYYTLVDAESGEVLYRANQIHHVANTDVNIKGTLHLTHPYDSATVEPMKNMKAIVGGITHYTNNSGDISLSNTSNTTANLLLEGRWVRVRTNNVIPSWTVNLTPGSNNIDADAGPTNLKQRTTYNAINTVHEYMKSKFATFTGLDYPLPANIDVSGSCNAFYNGSSVNFFDAGGGCNASSLVVDVCYHEYGHGINDKFYQSIGFQWANGAMGEGYADLWSLGITASPVLGIGFFANNPQGYIRRYDVNRKVFPQNLIGQVHNDGEIIAGAFWDAGVNLGNLQQIMDLFKETYYAGITGPNGTEGGLYVDILIETLAQDDNDFDLTNGTPNYCPIVAGFELHGISLGGASLLCAPVAMFTYQAAVVCAGSDINFTDASAFADSWDWSFPGGNPSTSTDQNPEINYTVPGVYDVTLTVTNAAGTDTHTETSVVNILPGTGQYAMPFYESFEAISFPGTEWQIENSGGGTWTQNNIAAKTGTQSVYIDNFNGNFQGTTDVFLTPTYDLSSTTANMMTFELAYAVTSSSSADRLKVFASTNCGQLWALRYIKTGSALATAGTITSPYIPDPSQWATQTVNLSSVSYNNKPNVRFKFEYTHDTGNDIYIDDINIYGTVGISEAFEESLDFSVYPNPVSAAATVSFNLENRAEIIIDVVDILGRDVNKIAHADLEAGTYQFELPDYLANGLYNVRILIDGNSVSKKVLINRLK